jgi:hypothetical protein
VSDLRHPKDESAARRFRENIDERVEAWRKAGACPDPACCHPGRLTLGRHPSTAPREVNPELRASLAAPITADPERERAGREEP